MAQTELVLYLPASASGTLSSIYWPCGATRAIIGAHSHTAWWVIADNGRPEVIHSTWSGQPPVPTRVPTDAAALARRMTESAIEREAAEYALLGDHEQAARLQAAAELSRTRKRAAGPRRRTDDALLAQVGHAYNEARAAGRPPAKAVREALPGYHPRHITKLIARARAARLIPCEKARAGRPSRSLDNGTLW